ncbi:MAG: hypothetical protein AB7S38_08120 [Vulcanimicrobiota bacterium]
MSAPVTILGTDVMGTSLGLLLAGVNWPLAGLWDPDHNLALTRSLLIGCSAFARLEEPVSKASLVLACLEDDAWATWAPVAEAALGPDALLVRVGGAGSCALLPIAQIEALEQAGRLRRAFFGLVGSDPDCARLAALVEALGGQPVRLEAGSHLAIHDFRQGMSSLARAAQERLGRSDLLAPLAHDLLVGQ